MQKQRTLPQVHVGVQLIPQWSHHCNTRKGIIWCWMWTVLLIKAPAETLLLYISPPKLDCLKKTHSAYPHMSSLIWQQPRSPLSHVNHHCFLCSTGELCLRAALITFTICYSYMQKAIFLRDPSYLRVAACLPSWMAEVCMCLISFELHC